MVTDSDCGLRTVNGSERDKELLFLCGNWRANGSRTKRCEYKDVVDQRCVSASYEY